MNWKLIIILFIGAFSLSILTSAISSIFVLENQQATIDSTLVEGLQLIVIHNPGCIHCVHFMQEARPDFESKMHIPLVVLDTSQPVPDWVVEANESHKIDFGSIRGTPTFILYDGIKERGRLVGYGSYDRFYKELNDLIQAYHEGI